MAYIDTRDNQEKRKEQTLNTLGGGIPAIASRFIVNKGAGYGNIPALGGAIKDTLVPPAKKSTQALSTAAGQAAGSTANFMFGTPENNTPLAPGSALKNGATVGDSFPAIDFNNPSINTQVKPPQPTLSNRPGPGQDINNAMDYLAKANGGQGTSGNVRYALDGNGNVIRSDANTMAPLTNNVTGLAQGREPFRITRENTGAPGGSAGVGFNAINSAIDNGTISANQGLGMYRNANASPEQQAQNAQQAQYQSLLDIALNGGATGDMSPTEAGTANKQQQAALKALGFTGQMMTNESDNAVRNKQIESQYKIGTQNAKIEAEDKKRRYELDNNRYKLDETKANTPKFGALRNPDTGDVTMYPNEGELALQQYAMQQFKASPKFQAAFAARTKDQHYKAAIEQGMSPEEADAAYEQYLLGQQNG